MHVGSTSTSFDFVVAEPGWTMFMVSHFHYDPVWWNTQGAYTSLWTEDPPGRARQTNAFELVHAHLEMARREPEYKFVLAEVDYLKPYWDTHPEDRADLRRLIAPRPGRDHGRHLQRAEHQPHQPRDDDPELSCTASVFSATCSAPTRQPHGSSTCSATIRSFPGWPPTPG